MGGWVGDWFDGWVWPIHWSVRSGCISSTHAERVGSAARDCERGSSANQTGPQHVQPHHQIIPDPLRRMHTFCLASHRPPCSLRRRTSRNTSRRRVFAMMTATCPLLERYYNSLPLNAEVTLLFCLSFEPSAKWTATNLLFDREEQRR